MFPQEWDHAAILLRFLAKEKNKLLSSVESEDVANVTQIFCWSESYYSGCFRGNIASRRAY